MAINPSSGESLRRIRPRMITILCVLIFLISLFHILKLSQVIIKWGLLNNLPITIPPIYLALDGFVWGVSGVILTWGLWTGQPWAPTTCKVLAVIYLAAFWIDLVFISEPDILKIRWLINLLKSLLGFSAIFITLNTKPSRNYFTGNPAKID